MVGTLDSPIAPSGSGENILLLGITRDERQQARSASPSAMPILTGKGRYRSWLERLMFVSLGASSDVSLRRGTCCRLPRISPLLDGSCTKLGRLCTRRF